jgi:hypothetical protein
LPGWHVRSLAGGHGRAPGSAFPSHVDLAEIILRPGREAQKLALCIGGERRHGKAPDPLDEERLVPVRGHIRRLKGSLRLVPDGMIEPADLLQFVPSCRAKFLGHGASLNNPIK